MPSTITPCTTFDSLCAGYLPTNPKPDQMPTVSISSASTPMSTHQSMQDPSANPSTLSAVLTTQAPDITVMANTINALVQSNVPSKVKLREPDTFNGSDQKKLRTFLLHCKLNFQECPDLFPDGTTKVNYVLSYLKRSALECFKPGLLDPTAHLGFQLQPFHCRTWSQLWNLWSHWKSRSQTQRTSYAGKSPSYKILHQVYTASHMCSVGPSSTPPTGI